MLFDAAYHGTEIWRFTVHRPRCGTLRSAAGWVAKRP